MFLLANFESVILVLVRPKETRTQSPEYHVLANNVGDFKGGKKFLENAHVGG